VLLSDESRIAAAQEYIDALVSRDGDSVPFAATCTRTEQGIKNGFSETTCAAASIAGTSRFVSNPSFSTDRAP
jgi:hypothetical protein